MTSDGFSIDSPLCFFIRIANAPQFAPTTTPLESLQAMYLFALIAVASCDLVSGFIILLYGLLLHLLVAFPIYESG